MRSSRLRTAPLVSRLLPAAAWHDAARCPPLASPSSACPPPRRAGSRSPRRASPTRARRARRTGAPCGACSIASASCRSTRSTCSSARTTCRCSAAPARTTSRCSTAPRTTRRGGCSSTGATRRRCSRSRSSRRCAGAWSGRPTTPGAGSGGSSASAPSSSRRCSRRCATSGPVAASAVLEHERPERTGPWWGWSDVKRAFEWLFWSGQITSARRRGFERLYDLPERVLPRGRPRGADAADRGGAAGAAPRRRALARRRHRVRPARLLPAAGRRGEAARPRAGGGRGALAGRGRGLARPGLPRSRRPDPAPGATRARSSARSTR